MRKKPPIHTVPDGSGWKNVQGGKDISHHRIKENAVKAGREQAQKAQTEHRIHNRDGKIRRSNSYGNDPCPPKDKK